MWNPQCENLWCFFPHCYPRCLMIVVPSFWGICSSAFIWGERCLMPWRALTQRFSSYQSWAGLKYCLVSACQNPPAQEHIWSMKISLWGVCSALGHRSDKGRAGSAGRVSSGVNGAIQSKSSDPGAFPLCSPGNPAPFPSKTQHGAVPALLHSSSYFLSKL